MSIKIMTAAWDTKLPNHTLKLVTMALADNANDEGYCWPSIATLAKKCDLTERAISSQISKLKALGILAIEVGGGRKSNRYCITLDTPERRSPLNAVHPCPERRSPQGGTPFTPALNAVQGNRHRTVKEPSVEPLPPAGADGASKRSRSKEPPDTRIIPFRRQWCECYELAFGHAYTTIKVPAEMKHLKELFRTVDPDHALEVAMAAWPHSDGRQNGKVWFWSKQSLTICAFCSRFAEIENEVAGSKPKDGGLRLGYNEDGTKWSKEIEA